MKNIFLTAFIILFLTLTLPAILIVGIRDIPDRYQPSLDRVQQVYSDVVISQSFISTDDYISMIGMSIKNPNLENKKDILLSIYDKDNQLLAKSVINGKSIPDGDFIKFKLSPIKESKNKMFNFNLSASSSSKLEALEVFLTEEEIKGVDDIKVTAVDIDQKEASMSISFVPFYKVTSPIALIFGIYSDWEKRFFADKAFSISYILLVILTIVILFAKWKPPYLKK